VSDLIKRILLITAAVVLVLGIGSCAYLVLKEPASRPAGNLSVESFDERIERGRYLAHHVALCIQCHSDKQGNRIGFPPVTTNLGSGGTACWDEATGHGAGFKVCPSNITTDAELGIGAWSDAEIIRAFREGVDRDGKALSPLMPYEAYRSLSDEDAKAILVYLRTLVAVRNAVPERELPFLTEIEIKFLPEPITGEILDPPAIDKVARGKYLTTIAGCNHCHTPTDEDGKPIEALAFSGGQAFALAGGSRVYASNLTPAKTGLGERAEAQFVGMFKAFATDLAARTSVAPGQNTVMPWLSYAHMKEDDLRAIFAYLKTLPPIENVVTSRRVAPPREVRREAVGAKDAAVAPQNGASSDAAVNDASTD